MTERCCIVPIVVRLRGIPDDERLDALSDAVRRAVSSRLLFADRTIADKEGLSTWHKAYAAPKFCFKGDPLDDDLRQRVAKAVEDGIVRAAGGSPASAPQARQFVLARYTPPAKKATASPPWRIHIKVDFHITPRHFFEIRNKYPRRPARPTKSTRRNTTIRFSTRRCRRSPWWSKCSREYEFTALTDEVIRHFGASRPSSEYIWGINGWGQLRAFVAQADRDHRVAGQIPAFGARGFVDSRPGPGAGEKQTILRPGAWVFSVFLPLPKMTLGDLVEIKKPQTIDVPASEAGVLVTPEVFRAEVGLDWARIEKDAPNLTVTLVTEVFSVRRKVHERALAALFEQYRRDTYMVKRLGRILPLTGSVLQGLGPTLGPFLTALADPNPSKPRGKIENGFWLPGTEGVNITPLFLGDFVDQVLRKLNDSLILSQADERSAFSSWRTPFGMPTGPKHSNGSSTTGVI